MRRPWVAAVVAPGVLLTACWSVLGIDELPRHDPAVDAPDASGRGIPTPIDYAEPACAVCVAEQCFTEESACRGDLSCSAAYACLAACKPNDVGCRAACEDGDPSATTGVTAYTSLDACRRGGCLGPCYGTLGLVASATDAACGACVDARCDAVQAACIADGSCERVFSCARKIQPLNPDRAIECQYRTTSGATLDALSGCYGSCSDVCPFGHDFRCSGAFAWQQGHGVVDYAITMRRFPDTTTFVTGAHVAACDVNDCETCSHPIAEGTTDVSGVAHLQLPVAGQGFLGCLRVAGDGFVPSLYFYGRPITRAEGRFSVSLLATSLLPVVELGAGVKLDPARGHVALDARDCLLAAAKGIAFHLSTADAASTPYYLVGGSISTSASSTDAEGAAGVLNVPPGEVVVTARDAATGSVVGRTTGRVAAGTITGIAVFPQAAP